MGKIRVKTLGDASEEKAQQEAAKTRREVKKSKRASPAEASAKEGKEHVKGVGLKGGQQVKVIEGVELKPEIEKLLNETPEELEKEQKKAKTIVPRVRSKRYKELTTIVDKKKLYPIKTAVELVKKTSTVKFDATVEVHININPAILDKDKPSLSGTINLPHGTGKKRVIAIADDTTIEKVIKGQIDFDVLVAHPSFMAKLAKVARILGPKGLMPNPKNGTISPTPEKRAKELEGGEMTWKTEPDHPVIHLSLGKVSFTEKQLEENLKTLIKSVDSGKITKLTLSSSMGPGIKVDVASL